MRKLSPCLSPLFLAALLNSLLLAGCSDESSGPIHFTHEQPFLPDFEKDSGFLPAQGQAQVRVLAKAGGSFTVEAEGTPAAGSLDPIEESGRAALGAQLSFEVFAKLDIGTIKFDDVVASMVYEIPSAEEVFTPFLLEEAAMMTVPLPAQTLGTVPIPSIPGASVRLDIAGGQLDLALFGVCAKSDAALAQYLAKLNASGTVNLAATVVVEVPVVGAKEFGPFSIPVPVPATEMPLDLGSYRRDGSQSDEVGPCMREDGGEDGSGGEGGSGGGGGGGGYDPNAENCGLPTLVKVSGIQQAEVSMNTYNNGEYYGLKFELEDYTIEALSYDGFKIGKQDSYRASTNFGPGLDFASKSELSPTSEGHIELSNVQGNFYTGTLFNATFKQAKANGTPLPEGCSFVIEDLSFSGQL